IIAAAPRQPRSQLVLHFNPKVPEVIAVAEPADKIRRIPGRIGVVLPEIHIADRPAFAVRGEIAQVAVRDEIAIAVVPGTIGLVDRCRDGVIDLGNIRPHPAHIPPEGPFDRCPAGPEQVIGRTTRGFRSNQFGTSWTAAKSRAAANWPASTCCGGTYPFK